MLDPMPESSITAFAVAEPLQIPAIVCTERSKAMAPANTMTGVGAKKPIASAI